MQESLNKIRKIRIKKLEDIKKLGIDPYPSKFDRKQKISQLKDLGEGKKAVTAGRLMGQRVHGKIVFADLKDASSQIQLVLKQDKLPKKEIKLLELLDVGDFIGIEGKTFTTKAGEFSIEVSKLTLLAKSLRPLPEKREGLKDLETRYRQRYIDLLVNPEVIKVFETRTKIINGLRNYLNNLGFLEVETPVLQPIYGGATAKPFITYHNALDSRFYLRIADELYLKRLIVGGWEGVYEFGKDFRNEGMDRQHNPEFTMLEFYLGYANRDDLITLTEDMLSKVVHNTAGSFKVEYEGDKISFKPPWEKVKFAELLKREVNLDLGKIDSEEKLLKFIKSKNIKLELKGIKGQAALLDEVYKKIARPKIKGPLFIIDHPFRMRPLAKRNPTDQTKALSLTLVVKGFELISAYSEINDPIDQRERWKEDMKLVKRGLEEYQMVDEDYIRALEYGMPPTAGWGLGIDRFVAIVTNKKSLKDVILFPTLKPEKF